MKVTIRDLETGAVRDCSEFGDWSVYWWNEGNGSCDCNRAIAMDLDSEMEARFGAGICYGCERFVIEDAHGDLEGWDKAELLKSLNREYKTSPAQV